MADEGNIPVFKVDPIMVIVYSFLTCGLYLVYWNMKVAQVLNAVAKREVISSTIAILPLCCPMIHVYFFYLCGQALGDLGKMIGKEEELKGKSTLLLVLGLLIPMVAAMIVQGHINELYAKNEAPN